LIWKSCDRLKKGSDYTFPLGEGEESPVFHTGEQQWPCSSGTSREKKGLLVLISTDMGKEKKMRDQNASQEGTKNCAAQSS